MPSSDKRLKRDNAHGNCPMWTKRQRPSTADRNPANPRGEGIATLQPNWIAAGIAHCGKDAACHAT